MNNPKVSIVMSVFNGEKYIDGAIKCVRAQTFKDYEFIIVNDGSSDKSGDLLEQAAREDSRIRVLHQSNTGLGPALHSGCTVARGELIARQDVDDFSEPGRIEKLVAYMTARPKVVVCGTWALFVHENFGPQCRFCMPDNSAEMVRLLESGQNPLIHGSIVMRREPYQKEGYRLRVYCEEFDLWLRMTQHGELGTLESTEYKYLLTAGSMSYQFINVNKGMAVLALKLNGERRTKGSEISDWKQEQERILAAKPYKVPVEERECADLFHVGLRSLKRRRYAEFREFMSRAAVLPGRHARYAGVLRYGWPAFAIRGLILWRDKRGIGKHFRYDV